MFKSGIFFFFFFSYLPILIPSSVDSSDWLFYVYVCYEDGPRIGREPRSDIRGNRMAASRLSCRGRTPRTATESCRLRNTFCPLRPSSSIARCGPTSPLANSTRCEYIVIIRERARDAVRCLRSFDMRSRCTTGENSLSPLCNKYSFCEKFVVSLNNDSTDS